VWAVTTHVLADPVTSGTGRNADTLWSGRTPLRTMLEAADWEATTAGGLLGIEVEPVVCLIAPGLPEPAFDFQGIRITEPNSLAEQVASSTADFVDVATVSSAVSRVFGAAPVAGTSAPTLGVPVVPGGQGRAYAPERRRSLGARIHALNSMRAVRVGVALALLAGVLAFLPTIIGLWDSVATEGAERLTDVIDEVDTEGSVDDASGQPPMRVRYRLTCPVDGGGWMAEWEWPGPLPDGVAGYAVRTQARRAPVVVHTLLPWSDPTAPPTAARIASTGATTVFTDHRSPAGDIIATTSTTIELPNEPC